LIQVTKYWQTGHFGDESFQAIHCTGTDNQKNETKRHIHPKHKR